jgi:oxygen-independent coproporphyrinogen-3 oxidase
MVFKENNLATLIQKYNVPCPRYTSYPTVPFWDNKDFNAKAWKQQVQQSFIKNGHEDGISLYIHLPYCESLCTYCGCNTRITVNHAVEIPYINALLEEWEMYKRLLGKNPKIKEIHLGGGTPTFFSPENIFQLIEAILCGAVIYDDAEFSFEAHPNNTTEEHLRVFYGFGFRRVSLGIQDFDLKVQEIVNRKQSYEQVEKLTLLARKIGYTSINYDLIYGLPLQTVKGISETIYKVIALKPDRIAFYSYAHVPWLKSSQRRFTELDLPTEEVKIKLCEVGHLLLKEAGYIEIGMDHFSLPTDSLYQAYSTKTMHRNFMGYTSSHTSMLIGLGCSSISDVWTAFAQNIKTVEEYIKEVNNGHLPVFNGHFHTEEDLLLRKHILNIMCKMETPLHHYDGLSSDIIIRLKELEKDGLVEIKEDYLRVTKIGEGSFLRNICMCFDERLHLKNSNYQFSRK